MAFVVYYVVNTPRTFNPTPNSTASPNLLYINPNMAENRQLIEKLLGIQEEALLIRNERNRLLEREAEQKAVKMKLTEQCKSYEYEIFNLEKSNAELRLRLVPDRLGAGGGGGGGRGSNSGNIMISRRR